MRKDSRAPPPNWPWSYRVEWRLMRLEETVFSETTDKDAGRPTWLPRDYLAAGTGIVMVIAALTERTGWTTAIAGLVKLYGGK